MTPIVSIIVPCYNQAKFLPQALESILNQTYKNWECFIVNDGSPDNCEEIALAYCKKDSRYKYHKKTNGGLSSARNAGLKICNGQFIQLLDSDDLIEKNKLNNAIELYQSERLINNKTIIYSGMRYFENSEPNILKILGRDNFVGHVDLNQYDSLTSQLELLKERNLCVISAPLYPKEVFINNDFDVELMALEDWDLNLRCIRNGYKFHYFYSQNSNTLIRLHDQSMMRDQKLLDENFYKFNRKHDLREEEKIEKNTIKEFIKILAPPILIKIYRGLLSK